VRVGQSPPVTAAPWAAGAERRQLTVLFCDLVGSTALAARLDLEDLRDVMRAYQAACADVICGFEGHVAKYLGDGVLAYFGWPKAHEDDAERAVRAGLELAGTIARMQPNGDVRLQARVGIATGQVVVGDLMGEGAAREEAVVGSRPSRTSASSPVSLTLTRLGRREGAALVERMVRDKALPDEVTAQIVAKTDGMPLFAEELTERRAGGGTAGVREPRRPNLSSRPRPERFPVR
jgi:hypothetical protein